MVFTCRIKYRTFNLYCCSCTAEHGQMPTQTKHLVLKMCPHSKRMLVCAVLCRNCEIQQTLTLGFVSKLRFSYFAFMISQHLHNSTVKMHFFFNVKRNIFRLYPNEWIKEKPLFCVVSSELLPTAAFFLIKSSFPKSTLLKPLNQKTSLQTDYSSVSHLHRAQALCINCDCSSWVCFHTLYRNVFLKWHIWTCILQL